MKDLKFRLNKTKTQKENLTPSKVYKLRVISSSKDSLGQLLFLVSHKSNYYILSQWTLDEFSMKKIKNHININNSNLDEIYSDVMNMVNRSLNGRIINYWNF